MRASSKDLKAITIRELTARLEKAGFVRCLGQVPKMSVQLNEESFLFIFPGVQIKQGVVIVDPVVGITNTKLESALSHEAGPWGNDYRVCHIYLGSVSGWGQLAITNELQIPQAVEQISQSLQKTAFPILKKYDSTDGVCRLFRDDAKGITPSGVAVLFAAQKLLALDRILKK
jgi:hypothetical protein